MLSPCGVKCDECKDYRQTCRGCRADKGVVYWAKYVNQTICPIYDCCINQKKFEDCGPCEKLPCHIYYDTQDPATSREEHEVGIRLRVSLLLGTFLICVMLIAFPYSVQAGDSVSYQKLNVSTSGGQRSVHAVYVNLKDPAIKVESALAGGRVGQADQLSSIMRQKEVAAL